MYTEATGNTATYDQSNPTESVWDAGASSWDIIGNAELTLWDVIITSFAVSSGDTTSFAASSGNAATYSEQSGSSQVWTEQ